MSENERLKALRNHLGLTQRLFSEALNIKQGSYSDVERGKAGISSLLLKNLIKKFRVNPIWLCEGKGSMFISESQIGDSLLDDDLGWENMAADQPNNKGDASENDDAINLLERHQQYIDSIKSLIEFIKE